MLILHVVTHVNQSWLEFFGVIQNMLTIERLKIFSWEGDDFVVNTAQLTRSYGTLYINESWCSFRSTFHAKKSCYQLYMRTCLIVIFNMSHLCSCHHIAISTRDGICSLKFHSKFQTCHSRWLMSCYLVL